MNNLDLNTLDVQELNLEELQNVEEGICDLLIIYNVAFLAATSLKAY